MTTQQIHDAIFASPAAKTLADAGNDAGAASSISATLPLVVQPIASGQLLIWGASRGVYSKVIAGTASTNAGIASACLAVQSMMNGGADVLDLTNPTISGPSGLLAALTAAGILPTNTDTTGANPTPGSAADLIAFGSAPQVVTPDQVSAAWAQYRPFGFITGLPS